MEEIESKLKKKLVINKEIFSYIKWIEKYYSVYSEIEPDKKINISGRVDFDKTNYAIKWLEEIHSLIIEGHTRAVSSVAISHDSKYVVSGSYDLSIRIWNLEKKNQEAVLRDHTSPVTCVAISQDNKYIVSGGDDRTIKVWNFKEKRLEVVLLGHDNFLRCLAITYDNKYIVSCGKYLNGEVIVWNLENKTKEFVLKKNITCIAVAHNNINIIFGSYKKIIVWSLKKKQTKTVLNGYSSYVNTISITKDDKYVVSNDGNNIRVCSLPSEMSMKGRDCCRSTMA